MLRNVEKNSAHTGDQNLPAEMSGQDVLDRSAVATRRHVKAWDKPLERGDTEWREDAGRLPGLQGTEIGVHVRMHAYKPSNSFPILFSVELAT